MIGCTVTNHGAAALDLNEMATACLAAPARMTEVIGFTGRWAGEFQRERLSRFTGGYLRESRRGRSSHDAFPGVVLCAPATCENAGEAYGLTLAWSGNHRIKVDTLSDGRVFASLGALFLPGEIRLAPGAHYISPDILAAYSSKGLSGMSRSFHSYVRSHILTSTMRSKPRLVHYNTWEAVYFDHGIDQLRAIADKAAAVGAERFVLDDGWFGSRRDDRSGLGDWFVSDAVYPQGLKPLIDHVTGLGMEMGIWFEPEMVNPDSDLFRAHPDWLLEIRGIDQIPYRHQFVLDISRTEVSQYLFERIDAILSDFEIGYIKWDMNRDHNHPGDHLGRPRSDAQVHALWALLDRLRAKHPNVEIESCASGGGRCDLGMLAHTDRVWTSDSNDAIDRQNIQRGASCFLPLEVLGAHVGPAHCHVTGRSLSMAMRAGTALMGHMGMEVNLLSEPAAELVELKAAIALYKQQRDLLHSGALQRLDTPDYIVAMGVVAPHQAEALFSVALVTGHKRTLPDRIYFTGLDPARQYRLRLVWPLSSPSRSSPSIVEALDLLNGGTLLLGDALMKVGLQLPLSLPETVLLFHLHAAGKYN
jgi:alpha-galactosidase